MHCKRSILHMQSEGIAHFWCASASSYSADKPQSDPEKVTRFSEWISGSRCRGDSARGYHGLQMQAIRSSLTDGFNAVLGATQMGELAGRELPQPALRPDASHRHRRKRAQRRRFCTRLRWECVTDPSPGVPVPHQLATRYGPLVCLELAVNCPTCLASDEAPYHAELEVSPRLEDHQ